MDKLREDLSVFGESIIQNCILKTFRQRCWGAWQVLIGEAGIIMVRINPKRFYKSPRDA